MPLDHPIPNTQIRSLPLGVLIPNWNGEAFIERCLGSVLAAVRRSGQAMEVVVIDDASGDRSPELIERGFPSVRLIRLERNVGFGAAVNRAMRQMQAEWVFLLNNDLVLRTDFCERLLGTLNEHDPGDCFAIGALTLDWETQAPNHGGQRACWRDGLIVQEAYSADRAEPTGFFQAGACLLDRRKFLSLGGFAGLYHPGYWEDYDLAYQARRAGWLNLYEPHAVAYHLGKSSMRERLGLWGLGLVRRRNHLLFNWVNLHDGRLLVRHLAGLGRLVLTDPGGPNEAGWGRALPAALGRLPAVLRERRRRLARGGLRDHKLLSGSDSA